VCLFYRLFQASFLRDDFRFLRPRGSFGRASLETLGHRVDGQLQSAQAKLPRAPELDQKRAVGGLHHRKPILAINLFEEGI